MAAGKTILLLILLISEVILPSQSCFPAIFSFGDSLADTGNLLASTDGHIYADQPPYGETYFHRPTGRFSDGRLVIDFIAQAMGLPLVPPYLAGSSGQDFRLGVNFAVSGVTAMSDDFFTEKGLTVMWANYSLGTQIQLFKNFLPSLCFSKLDCDEIINNSLFLVGEIGVNDYIHPFSQGRSLAEIQTYIPSIINAISSAVTGLIELGAKTLVVPGNFPMGCISMFLTVYQSKNIYEYDPETGCIKWLNELSEQHNSRLKEELEELRQRNIDATIIYADYYESMMSIYRSPHKFGFNQQSLIACCGGGGPYNYNLTFLCGNEGSMSCEDPSKYIGWDGVHFTEAAYNIIADGWMKGPYAAPTIESVCSNKNIHLLNQVFNPGAQDWQSHQLAQIDEEFQILGTAVTINPN